MEELHPRPGLQKGIDGRPHRCSIGRTRECLDVGSDGNLDHIKGYTKLEEYKQSVLEQGTSVVEHVVSQFSALEDVYLTSCKVLHFKALREMWMEVYTTVCYVSVKDPCGKCRGCRIRMCQALVIVLAAQGVADKVILPHLAAVFRHRRYRNFSVEEWAMLSITEISAIFKRCSCHNKSAFFMHFFLLEILHHGPPTNLRDLMCFRGFQKKSACLWLKAVYNINFGVPTDSHVVESAIALGWVPANTSEELASYMLEMYLPRELWEIPNIYLAGIRQNLSIGPEETFVVLSCAWLLGKQTLSLVETIFPRDFRHPHGLEEQQSALLEGCRMAVQSFIHSDGQAKSITTNIVPPLMSDLQHGGRFRQQTLSWAHAPKVGDQGLLPAVLVDRKRSAKECAKRKCLFADAGKGQKQLKINFAMRPT